MSSAIIVPHFVQLVTVNGLAALIAFDTGFTGVGVPIVLPADAEDFLPAWILTAGFLLTIITVKQKSSVYLSQPR